MNDSPPYFALYDPKGYALVFAASAVDLKTVFEKGRRVFVCGALQNPEKMADLIGRAAAFAPAAVNGYQRNTQIQDGKPIPYMLPAQPDALLTGVVWLALSQKEFLLIEKLELKGGYRKLVDLNVKTGERVLNAVTYIKR